MKKSLAFISLILLLTLAAGCVGNGQIFWSPDGSHAAYNSGGDGSRGMVIDASGKIPRDLGSASGFAWSADSKTLYYSNLLRRDAGIDAAKELSGKFTRRDDYEDAPFPSGQPSKDNSLTTIFHVYQGDTDTPLFALDHCAPGTLLLSPDGNWLTAIIWENNDKDTSLELYAFSLKSHTLFPLARNCGLGMCFTGPDRLAFVASAHPAESSNEEAVGMLTEIKLSDLESPAAAAPAPSIGPAQSAGQRVRSTLAEMMLDQTDWLQSLDGDIFFVASEVQFPHIVAKDSAKPVQNLYRHTRAGARLVKISENVGSGFAISPDGKRILFEKMNPLPAGGKPQQGDDGSAVQTLRDLRQYKNFSMLPNWRGSDEIAFVPSIANSPPPDANGKIHFDVVLYRITDKGLEPICTLSRSWKEDQKPEGEAAPR